MIFVFGVETITRNGEEIPYALGADDEANQCLYYQQYLYARAVKGARIDFADDESKRYFKVCQGTFLRVQRAREATE